MNTFDLAVIKNNTTTIGNLTEKLKDIGLFSLAQPKLSIYENGIRDGKTLLEVNIYFSLNDGDLHLQVWRAAVYNPYDMTRNHGYGSFNWCAEEKMFVDRFGKQLTFTSALTSVIPFCEAMKESLPNMDEELRTVLALTAYIIHQDRPFAEPSIPSRRSEYSVNRVIDMTKRYSREDILAMGVERLAYLSRLDKISDNAEEMITTSPITWLAQVYAPFFADKFKAVSVPAMDETMGGYRRLLAF